MKLILFVKFVFCLLFITKVNANTFLWNSNTNQETPLWQRTSIQNQAVCVDIPSNLTLCQGIGYTKMRLPNLLNHDSLREVSQQATSWVPLYQLNCHPDTQLFLCSLFSPVCLDHPIPPCRSLCQSVQASCEHVMLNYGYPWPKIIHCDQYPVDNDMCIQAQHSASGQTSSQSLSDKGNHNLNNDNKQRKGSNNKNSGKKQRRFHSNQDTDAPPVRKETVYEPQPGLQRSSQLDLETKLRQEPQVDQVINNNEQNNKKPNRNWNKDQRQLYNDIISQFCKSEWILKARLYPLNPQTQQLKVRNYRLIHGSIKNVETPLVLIANNSIFDLLQNQESKTEPTQQIQSRRRYFIMGKSIDNTNSVTHIMQWPHKSAQLRKAIKAITNGNFNCNLSDNSDRSENIKSEKSGPTQRQQNRKKNKKNKSPKEVISGD